MTRLVGITSQQYKVVGYPIQIESERYPRNMFLFNLCFVFDKRASSNVYDQVVKKMALLLHSLEVESSYLSNEATSSGLTNILEQVLYDLNTYHECQIYINDANTIDLKLFPEYADPPTVYDYQVPILIADLASVVDRHWDLTMRKVLFLIQILPYVNGVNSVKRIYIESEVHPNFVRNAIQHLLYYGCASLVDMFQFSNIYTVNAKITRFFRDQQMQAECLKFVAIDTTMTCGEACALYAGLKGGIAISEFCLDNAESIGKLDVRRFVIFGVMKGFIYRVHKYPIMHEDLNVEVSKYLDGRHHMDEICTIYGCSSMQLERLLGENVHYILK